jgi:type VI secretion system protein ImpE
VLGGTLEAITGAGECAWIPLAHVAAIQFAKPERSRDLLWREAAVTLCDGQTVNCFVPMIYSGTHKAKTDALKLGRATEWSEPAEGLVRGTGQRMWLVGEDVKPVLEISEVAIGSE